MKLTKTLQAAYNLLIMSSIHNFVSFNCKSIKRSVECIRQLCLTSHIIALQETWLLPGDIDFLSCINKDFGYTGTSAVDLEGGMLKGRPYGGVALLWNKSVFPSVSIIPCDNPRVCAVKINIRQSAFIVCSIYMPTESVINLADFTDCLGLVSAIISNDNIESVYLLGDFNAHPSAPFYIRSFLL